MNESQPSLDDLALFLAVADGGSLTAAARTTRTPLPTLSRRMTKLEQTCGRPLFLRGASGYHLTEAGRDLADRIGALRDIPAQVSRWQTAGHGPARVRITAGFWTSRYLAQTLGQRAPSDIWVPAFLPSNTTLDLARRAADIGIRNAPPDHPWLARQRLRAITYAVYAVDPLIKGYVSLPADAALPPSQRWLHTHHGDAIVTTASDTRLCLDLALAGYGRIVMPTFAGDSENALTQVSPVIEALTHDEWLVSHNAARHDPPVRAALDAITRAFRPDAH